jgi:hypothetical protein
MNPLSIGLIFFSDEKINFSGRKINIFSEKQILFTGNNLSGGEKKFVEGKNIFVDDEKKPATTVRKLAATGYNLLATVCELVATVNKHADSKKIYPITVCELASTGYKPIDGENKTASRVLAANSHVVYGVVKVQNMIPSPFQRAYSGRGLSQRDKDVKTPFGYFARQSTR